jgi:glycosyltransferase involved in cell wall biosynthesis
MRWLVISPYLPHPEIGHGGGTAVLQLCCELARHHEVTLLCFQREDEAGRERWLQGQGVEVRALPWRSDQARGLARIGLIADRARVLLAQQRHDRPFMVEKYDRAELRRAVDRLLDERSFDVVQVEYSFMAPVAAHARAHPARPAVLLNTHEIASLPRQRELDLARDPVGRARARQALRRWIEHERTLAESADRVLCVTDQDRSRLASILGDDSRLRTVPLGYSLEGMDRAHREASQPPRLLFVGSFTHPPNLTGVRIFLEEILPLIHAIRPEIAVDIVGRAADPHLLDLADRSNGRVVVHGFVPDLEPLWRRSTLFVAPLYSGGGIKIKVLEALARSACVVATPIAVEGIDEAGSATVVADTPEDFAGAVLELVDDPERRTLLGTRAHTHVEANFTWESIVRRLAAIADEVGEPRAQSEGRQSGSEPPTP